ncbi:MAG: hypothetical protein F4Y84_06245 [Caldilineaceae bacterium SB0665_bin_25]|nr:hypothetical protein [Caldilineaceae bacterium SB0665_bin_25]
MSFSHPFPATRPSISITESDKRITQLDLTELQWWPVVPSLGHSSMQATYEADTQELSAVTEMAATSLAGIHDQDCVEITVRERAIREDWDVPGRPHLFYARLDEKETRWLGVVQQMGERKALRTFKDEWFEAEWGRGAERKICDDGRYQRQPDGTYRTTGGRGIGAGTYDVVIGSRTFHCLRAWDTFGSPPSEHAELAEAFIEEGGRVVLYRQYRGRQMGRGETDWAVKYPDNSKIVIDGCVYVHCNCTARAHDLITNTAIGVNLSPKGIGEQRK